ncbi:MAG: hypothetical protein GF411_16305 [Candidatus Lokiarchaeota archaeon]|nr:hypothetical protein [Candidatus Lokiarchaeota archaeon]
MRIKKWLMKQQWRIVQVRGIWGLFYSTLLLAYSYFIYIPLFEDMGTWGPFAFAATALVFFLILGYVYDRVLVMWAPSGEVTTERNPYQYVPSPKEEIFWFPLFSSLLTASQRIAKKLEIDDTEIQETKEYYAKLSKFTAERKDDIEKAIALRKKYMIDHNMSDFLEIKAKSSDATDDA